MRPYLAPLLLALIGCGSDPPPPPIECDLPDPPLVADCPVGGGSVGNDPGYNGEYRIDIGPAAGGGCPGISEVRVCVRGGFAEVLYVDDEDNEYGVSQVGIADNPRTGVEQTVRLGSVEVMRETGEIIRFCGLRFVFDLSGAEAGIIKSGDGNVASCDCGDDRLITGGELVMPDACPSFPPPM